MCCETDSIGQQYICRCRKKTSWHTGNRNGRNIAMNVWTKRLTLMIQCSAMRYYVRHERKRKWQSNLENTFFILYIFTKGKSSSATDKLERFSWPAAETSNGFYSEMFVSFMPWRIEWDCSSEIRLHFFLFVPYSLFHSFLYHFPDLSIPFSLYFVYNFVFFFHSQIFRVIMDMWPTKLFSPQYACRKRNRKKEKHFWCGFFVYERQTHLFY